MASLKPRDDLADAIPMNKTKPTTILLALAGVTVVGGALAFTFTRGGEKKINPNAEGATAPTTTMTPEEQKRHLEITRKSLEAFEKQEAEKQQKKQAEPESAPTTAPAAEHAAPKAGSRSAGGTVAAAGPARPAAAPPPEPAKPPKKANKKAMGDLDGLGSDIAGQLGK